MKFNKLLSYKVGWILFDKNKQTNKQTQSYTIVFPRVQIFYEEYGMP